MTIAFFGRVRSSHIESKERPAANQWLVDRCSNWNRWFDRLDDLLAIESNQAKRANARCPSRLPV
jgi:hypothetical protein